jgi:hypothetical protein
MLNLRPQGSDSNSDLSNYLARELFVLVKLSLEKRMAKRLSMDGVCHRMIKPACKMLQAEKLAHA